MNEKRDLVITLVGTAVLLGSLTLFAQCRSKEDRTSSGRVDRATPSVSETEGERAGKRKSINEIGEEEDNEERAKIQQFGRALQTIGANPTLRRTFGLPK